MNVGLIVLALAGLYVTWMCAFIVVPWIRSEIRIRRVAKLLASMVEEDHDGRV